MREREKEITRRMGISRHEWTVCRLLTVEPQNETLYFNKTTQAALIDWLIINEPDRPDQYTPVNHELLLQASSSHRSSR